MTVSTRLVFPWIRGANPLVLKLGFLDVWHQLNLNITVHTDISLLVYRFNNNIAIIGGCHQLTEQ